MKILVSATATLVLLTSGCTLFNEPSFPSEASGQTASAGQAPSEVIEVAALPPLKPAAASLLNSASGKMASGNPGGAVADLDRALRIDPDHPAPWLALAKLRMSQGDLAQSENLARRSLNLSPRGSDSAAEAEALLSRLQAMPR